MTSILILATGSGHKAEHNIYIWDKKMGNLLKILEGPKEPLDDLTVSVLFHIQKRTTRLTNLAVASCTASDCICQ